MLIEEQSSGERRKSESIHFLGLEFDKKINLPGAVALLVVLYGLYSGFSSMKLEFTVMAQQHNLMWKHFIIHEKDITQEELASLFK